MKRILVVDDDEQVRQIVKKYLKKQGYHVYAAESGAKALSLLEAFQPDLVFLDIVMPDMSGLDVLPMIKQKYPELRVIMLTGLNQEEIWRKAMTSGATDFLSKPFSFEQLWSNVTLHLALK